MPKRSSDSRYDDRTQRLTDALISHVDNAFFSPSRCPWHLNRTCFLLLSNFDKRRYHCLYAKDSPTWRSYDTSLHKWSCDLPEHFHDAIVLQRELGRSFVLPFSTHFRERAGYTIGLFRLDRDLFGPSIVSERNQLKFLFFRFLVLFCALCRQLGGVQAKLGDCTFLYERPDRPVLVDVGSRNSDKRERIGEADYANDKSWTRFLRSGKTADMRRFVRANHPTFFKKKTRRGSRCILADEDDEGGGPFDDETHQLICQSIKEAPLDLMKKFGHLAKDEDVRTRVIAKWIADGEKKC